MESRGRSPDVFPLKQHAAFVEGHSREAIDPLESLLEAIKSGRSGRVRTEFWLELLPRKRKEGERAELNSRYLDARFRLRLLKSTFMRSFSRSDAKSRLTQWLIRKLTRVAFTVPDEVADKLERNLYSTTIRIAVSSMKKGSDPLRAADYSEGVAALQRVRPLFQIATEELANRKTAEIASALKLVTHPNSIFFVEKKPNGNNFQLSSPEIATLWHIPTVGGWCRIASAIFCFFHPFFMATRSIISRSIEDGFEGVYCHWDGYLEHVGALVREGSRVRHDDILGWVFER